jgi:hypothetical protein
MSNIVRSFIDEFVPAWATRRALRQAAEQAAAQKSMAEAQEIHMPVEVAMPMPSSRRAAGPYQPQPTPSHWRAPNM